MVLTIARVKRQILYTAVPCVMRLPKQWMSEKSKKNTFDVLRDNNNTLYTHENNLSSMREEYPDE